MVEWLIAAAVFVALMLALPRLLGLAKSRARGGGGLGVGLFMMFASVFDPARSAAVEEIDKRKDFEENDESGAPAV